MREGKVSQAVLDRSVLRTIKNKNPIVELGGEIGRDSSIINVDKQSYLSMDTRTVCVHQLSQIESAFIHLVNHAACSGTVARTVIVSIVLPSDCEEEYLSQIMKTIEAQSTAYSMQVMGGHTTVNKDVAFPVVTLTVVGADSVIDFVPCAKPGQDIVVTKWIALEGTGYAAFKHRDMLAKKLPKHIIDEACNFNKLILAADEALWAYKSGASIVHDVGEGGIFAALWEFAYASKIGIEVDIKKIPIRQETVEISELLQINPYELLSTGSVIIASDNGDELCRSLLKKNINAVNVGHTTDKNDRVLINGDEIRHLTPADQDAVFGLE